MAKFTRKKKSQIEKMRGARITDEVYELIQAKGREIMPESTSTYKLGLITFAREYEKKLEKRAARKKAS